MRVSTVRSCASLMPGHAQVGGVRVTGHHVGGQLGQAIRARGGRRAGAEHGDQAAAEEEADQAD